MSFDKVNLSQEQSIVKIAKEDEEEALKIAEADSLRIIRDEHASSVASESKLDEPDSPTSQRKFQLKCGCIHLSIKSPKEIKKDEELIQAQLVEIEKLKLLLEDKEILMTEQNDEIRCQLALELEKERDLIKERFDFILQNEQLRAAYMLREAHRERQEKISALQSQLECKNLAALMYVICTERRRSKMEKLKLVEEYTKYIHSLQDILSEAQALILNLSRGFKTAARVDHEWREKMKNIISEFQIFIYNFAGGPEVTNQYFFDIPTLLKTKAPINDNPKEDPCECESERIEEEEIKEKEWWEVLEGDCRPFIMFGDMAEFKPPQRRQVLKTIKATKTAPKKWKEYAFHDMFLQSLCSNSNQIKDEYLKRFPRPIRWECEGVQTHNSSDGVSK